MPKSLPFLMGGESRERAPLATSTVGPWQVLRLFRKDEGDGGTLIARARMVDIHLRCPDRSMYHGARASTSVMSDTRTVALTVNGQSRQATVEVRATLVDLLREEFRLTGTHIGCEHGVCGACTVLVNGDAVRACLMLAVQANGARVETVESLAPDPEHLNPLQLQFVRHHGVQCGFCIGGILMSLTAALRDNPHPTEVEIRDTLAGHLCRCTGYQGMVDAVLALAAVEPAVVSR